MITLIVRFWRWWRYYRHDNFDTKLAERLRGEEELE